MYPAAFPVAVAHAAPMAVLGDNLQWHVAVFEHPVDAMRERRATSHVGLGRLQGNKARHRKIGDRTAFGSGHGCAGQKPERKDAKSDSSTHDFLLSANCLSKFVRGFLCLVTT